ncbi:MAG: hypothetical protein GF320_18925 [Armatimonadia bacterium]|nr:hypothetical protein [Armatimonadia bacterium]
MKTMSGCAIVLLVMGLCSVAMASETLRFQPPIGYSQDFEIEVDGTAVARDEHIQFHGTMQMNQLVTGASTDLAEPIPVEVTLLEGEIHYNDKMKPSRYIGDPLKALRTPLGQITSISQPLDDDDETGIDVTAAVLYASSLLVFPERETRPGATWDGSHDAFDPYGDYVPVTAENRFADMLELPDATLIQVDSEGHFPYHTEVDDRVLEGTLEYYLEMTLEKETGTLREARLKLYGELTTDGPIGMRIGIHVRELNVHIEQTEARIEDLDEPESADPPDTGDPDAE